jgi:hypothetical protein
MLDRLLQLEREGLTSVNLYNFCLGRRLIPLQQRAHLMWKYTESGKLTWSTGTEWDKKEYTVAMKSITTAQFTSLEEGLPPFTPDNTAVPMVSRVLHEFLSLLLKLILMSFVFLQTFNILQGTLPPLDGDLPKNIRRRVKRRLDSRTRLIAMRRRRSRAVGMVGRWMPPSQGRPMAKSIRPRKKQARAQAPMVAKVVSMAVVRPRGHRAPPK